MQEHDVAKCRQLARDVEGLVRSLRIAFAASPIPQCPLTTQGGLDAEQEAKWRFVQDSTPAGSVAAVDIACLLAYFDKETAMSTTHINRFYLSVVCVVAAAVCLSGYSRNVGRPLPLSGTREHSAYASTRFPITVSIPTTVQPLPAYIDAERACARGRYKQAAEILARMQLSPSLTSDQRAFCKTQEQICLGHLVRPAVVYPSSPHLLSLPATRSLADCGPRALLIACQKLGVSTSLEALTKAAQGGPGGTSLLGLKTAAASVHLKAEAVQSGREALPDLTMPAIAWVHGDHFVAVLALQGRGESGTAVIRDPNEPATRTITQENLLQSSRGYLLSLRR